MPTLRTPLSRSTVWTSGKVTKRPPSNGQHFRTGSSESRTSSPVRTTCWHAPRPRRFRGSQRDIRSSSGSMRSLSDNDVFGAVSSENRLSIRRVRSSRLSTPSARAIRRSEPIMFVRTGKDVPVRSNSSARPPPGRFDSRSVNSAISSTGSTSAATLTSSPARSSAATYSQRFLYTTRYVHFSRIAIQGRNTPPHTTLFPARARPSYAPPECASRQTVPRQPHARQATTGRPASERNARAFFPDRLRSVRHRRSGKTDTQRRSYDPSDALRLSASGRKSRYSYPCASYSRENDSKRLRKSG